jgi:hypothetical protein
MRSLLRRVACRRAALVQALPLLLAAGISPVSAQTDLIRGRVTDTEGQPVVNVRVTATSIPGNVTRNAQTDGRGNFQIVFPGGTGDYIMGYAHFGFSYRQLQVKRLADEPVLVADVRLAPIQLDSLMVTAAVQQRVTRNQQTPDVGGTEQRIAMDALPPELQGDIAAMAASLPGVLLVPGLDGADDAFSVLGLDPDQNSVTLNGMPLGANGLPRDAQVSSSLATSPFDVSRGGFSGGNFNISTRAGSNLRSRGSSFVLTTPQMQWTDRAAQALGNDVTNLSLSGMASGPVRTNKSFYNVSYQLNRQARDNRTLLGTSALGLQTAGIAPDSVSRFVDILGGHGIPTAVGSVPNNRLNDSGSVFGSVDIAPPSSSSGTAYNLTFNGNWRRQTPVGGPSQLGLASSAGDRTAWGGGLQARHSAYLGMILTETSAGFNLTREHDAPYLALPGGRVRVHSAFDDGSSGVQTLAFGGNQSLGSSSSSAGVSLQNSLSWFDNANRHRLKLSTELRYSGREHEQSANVLGTFHYNSLEDFEAGRPASFTRTLGTRERSTGQFSGSLALGDTYRHSTDLQFQLGLRVDASGYTTMPDYNARVEHEFGLRNDRVPTPIVISPRVGFSWTYGRAQEIAMFAGAARRPRAMIRGGIGVFASNAGAGQIGQVLDNTGLPSGEQQIVCVGPAVPLPDWGSYGASTASLPDRCADGTSGTVFSSSAPNVTLFARDYAPPHTIRSNLSWSGSALDGRFSLNVDGTYSLNRNRQRFLDLNFDPTQRFVLPDEGRPVYVATSSIVPQTGAIASRDARVSQEFARVTELRSDLQSRTAQLSIRLAPITRGPSRFGWNAAYTYSHIREQVSGFSSTAGNPLDVQWSRSGQGPHQVNYTLRYNFFDAVQVSWSGTLRSGGSFTPMVAGDVNGDGYANDRAFVLDPSAAADPQLAQGMRDLLASAPDATRQCLEKQLGTIAGRNSCRGPWTSTASLNATLDRAKFRLPPRAGVSLSLSNPLGAADLLVNGSGNLKGWGQSPFPDPSLLYVRGFDPETRHYRYEVNQRFGATRPQFLTLRSPVTLTASIRYDLGPTREKQMLLQQLRAGSGMAGSPMAELMFRQIGAGGISNPLATILRSQDTLQLNALQADSIAAMNRRYTYRADSLWAPVGKYLAELPPHYHRDQAYRRYLNARHQQVDMLVPIVAAVRDLLTPAQRRKLPTSVTRMLDPQYLALVRSGTGLYTGSGGTGSAMGFPIEMMGADIQSITIIR